MYKSSILSIAIPWNLTTLATNYDGLSFFDYMQNVD